MNWINVKDQLPPQCERVLTCTEDGYISVDFLCSDGWYNIWNTVKFWMPLPKPPISCQDSKGE